MYKAPGSQSQPFKKKPGRGVVGVGARQRRQTDMGGGASWKATSLKHLGREEGFLICVCVRETERDRYRDTEKETETQRETKRQRQRE